MRRLLNTAQASLMKLNNAAQGSRYRGVRTEAWQAVRMVLMMAPITPHLAEELWERWAAPTGA